MSESFRYPHNPQPYPIALVHKEIEIHRATVEEYAEELSVSMFDKAKEHKPDINLIGQQPHLTPRLREPLLDFLFKVCKRTRVCPHLFYKSVRLLDRYCSKRIVLLDQAQLMAATCLWLSAKVDGGCNHCVSSTSCPIAGRQLNPTVRSRIPRLRELCILCGSSCNYDDGMFIQMERHILDTLQWDVTTPNIHNWVLSVEDKQNSLDLEHANLKQFAIDASLYSFDLISTHPADIASSISDIVRKVMPLKSKTALNSPAPNHITSLKVLSAIVNATDTCTSMHASSSLLQDFLSKCRILYASLGNRGFDLEDELEDDESLFDQSNSSTCTVYTNVSPLPSPSKMWLPSPPRSRKNSPSMTGFTKPF